MEKPNYTVLSLYEYNAKGEKKCLYTHLAPTDEELPVNQDTFAISELTVISHTGEASTHFFRTWRTWHPICVFGYEPWNQYMMVMFEDYDPYQLSPPQKVSINDVDITDFITKHLSSFNDRNQFTPKEIAFLAGLTNLQDPLKLTVIHDQGYEEVIAGENYFACIH